MAQEPMRGSSRCKQRCTFAIVGTMVSADALVVGTEFRNADDDGAVLGGR